MIIVISFCCVKAVKASRKTALTTQRMSLIMDQFPLARRDSTISPEFNNLWEKRATHEKQHDANAPPLYEKVSLILSNATNY